MVLLLLAPASCVSGPKPTAPTPGLPIPVGRDPEVRVGLVVGAVSAAVGGGSALAVTGPDGSHLWMIPPGETWQVAVAGNAFTLGTRGWTSAPLEAVTLTPAESNPLVRVNGKGYRGSVVILRGGTGITVINRVGLESYLLGVVSAEMGRRGPAEQAALRAQAVVSRTYALRNLGRWKAQGFDLVATVAAQVYSGQGGRQRERLLQYFSPLPLARGMDRGSASEHTATEPPIGHRCAQRGCPRGQQRAGDPPQLVRPGGAAHHRTGRAGGQS
jgi:hypothetical protein